MSQRVRIAIAVAIGVVLLTVLVGYSLNETGGDDSPAPPEPGTPLFDALDARARRKRRGATGGPRHCSPRTSVA